MVGGGISTVGHGPQRLYSTINESHAVVVSGKGVLAFWENWVFDLLDTVRQLDQPLIGPMRRHVAVPDKRHGHYWLEADILKVRSMSHALC